MVLAHFLRESFRRLTCTTCRHPRVRPQTLESLSPLLTPFFHLVHPKTHASHPGPFTRLDPSSSASRSALDLVWYLAGSRSSSGGDGIESQPVMGLVAAVERACALVGGEAAQRWESLRGRSMAV